MHHIVGFRSTIEACPPLDPRAEPTADLIARGLKEQGFAIVGTDSYRDIASAVKVSRDGGWAWFFVGYLGLETSEWQLIAPEDGDVFGGTATAETRQALAAAIHQVLSEDDRVSDVRWFETFSDSPHDDWSPTPT